MARRPRFSERRFEPARRSARSAASAAKSNAALCRGLPTKYHDGFLGHSYVGEWVNLAAGTITGDLRFDYQPIAVRSNGESILTGEVKLGSIFGDHVRTGLGVLLDCGTVIRPFATILPMGRLAPREIAAFTQISPGGVRTADVEAALRSSAIAMSRRGVSLTPALEALYRGIAGQSNTLPLRTPVYEARKSA